MFFTAETATESAMERQRCPEFRDSDRASAIVSRLELGNEAQQSVAAVIAAATAEFVCSDCNNASDPFVFMLQDDDGHHHLAVACPHCQGTN